MYIANIVVNSLVIFDLLKAKPCEMRDVTDQIYKVKKIDKFTPASDGANCFMIVDFM